MDIIKHLQQVNICALCIDLTPIAERDAQIRLDPSTAVRVTNSVD